MKRFSVTITMLVGAVAALSAGAPASATAGATNATRATVGDTCLVGTWHDNAGRTSTIWRGRTVPMHAGGGDVDHIAATGVDHDNWQKSKPIVGTYQGHRLTERVRGHNKVVLTTTRKGGKRFVTAVEKGWTTNSTNRYVYRGKHSRGYLNQTGTRTVRYRCTATTLTYLSKKGKVTGTETRLSRTP